MIYTFDSWPETENRNNIEKDKLNMRKIKIYILKGTFSVFLFFGFLLSFSCSHSIKSSLNNSSSTQPERNKIYNKIPLEFAIAGEAIRYNLPDTSRPIQNKDSIQNSKLLQKKNRRKPSKRDSLYMEMIQKAKRLKESKVKLWDYKLNMTPNPLLRDQKEKVPTKSPQLTDFLNKKKDSLTSLQDFLSPEQVDLLPDPDFGQTASISASPNRPITDYKEMVNQFQNGTHPIWVKIGYGKKYWISSLANLLFPMGSSKFNQTLDWIVEHNNQFHTRKDLDRIRDGDVLLLPVKKTIQDLQ